jgi:hypothetical protein
MQGVRLASKEEIEVCVKWMRGEKMVSRKRGKLLVKNGGELLRKGERMFILIPGEYVLPAGLQKLHVLSTQSISCSSQVDGKEEVTEEGLWSAMKDRFKIDKELSEEKKQEVLKVLRANLQAFSKDRTDVGYCDLVVHEIETGGQRPIKLKPYRLSYAEEREAHRQIAELVETGRVVKCNSPWAFPVIMVVKKDGVNLRMCVDYRALNKATKPWSYPLPYIQDVLERLGKSTYFAVCDVMAGFWNVPLKESDMEKTAFVTRGGQWMYKVMPFGLSNAPATFQSLMNTLFDRNVFQEFVEIFIDDLCIHHLDWSGFLRALELVLQKLTASGLKLVAEKCKFGYRSVGYLGHIVSKEGTSPDPAKVAGAQKLLPPTTVTEVRAFLGLVGYYRRFIHSYSQIARPLNQLTQKGEPFVWDKTRHAAFKKLKEKLVSAPILVRPDPLKPFILDTDFQTFAVAAILSQKGEDGKEHVVSYASKGLSKTAQRWPSYEGEMFAVVWAIDKFRQYLDNGMEFLLRTDHKPLLTLTTTTNPTRKVAGWITKLQGYRFQVQYREGKSHSNVDGLSRARSSNIQDAV